MEREQAIKFMRDLLKLMIEKGGSDLFITVGFPPAMKIHGKMTPVSKTELTPGITSYKMFFFARRDICSCMAP